MKKILMKIRPMPVADWPAADRAGWLVASQPRDLLNPKIGYANRWKESTRKLNVDGYGRFLAWHEQIGGLDRALKPSQRISLELVTAYWKEMQAAGLAPHTVAGRMQQLGSALQAIEPAHDWQWVRRGAYRLQAAAKPINAVAQAMPAAQDLLALGLDMMDAAENDRYRTPVDRATLFRDGLMTSLLILTVIRRANLASIIIGEHLTRSGNGWWLSFDPASTKGGRRLEFSFPDQLVPSLERYLDVHRKVLLKCSRKTPPPTDALWISQHGTHMTGCAIAIQIKARTEDGLGMATNPHKFRHTCATTIATSDAGRTCDIMDILGHSSGRAAEKYYNKAKMVDAGRRHQQTIDAKRSQPSFRLD